MGLAVKNVRVKDGFILDKVRVFCPQCKEGDNAIWEGSLIDFSIELSKHRKPPAWFLYALNHEKTHEHKVMVEYPNRTVPLSG